MGSWFGQLWIWAAIVVLVAIIVLMYALASRYYGQVREAVGLRGYQTPKDAPDPTPVLGAKSSRPPRLATART